jgi:uncharacterized protein YciI
VPLVLIALAVALAVAQQPSVPAPKDLQTFQVALLFKGSGWTAERTTAVQQIQQAHADYLASLSSAGQLAASGPMAEEDNLRGLLLLRVADLTSARSILADDPAVKAGRLRFEIETLLVPGNWFSITNSVKDSPTRQFIVGLLIAGSRLEWTPDEVAAVQAAHLAHLWKMRETGAMVLAGPFDGTGPRRGIVVFASDNLPAVRALANDDPGVRAGRLAVELNTWFGPDGVMKVVRVGS